MHIVLLSFLTLVSTLTSFYSPNSQTTIVLEDFQSSVTGQFPKNWGWIDNLKVRPIKDAKEGQVPYIVQEENGNKYLHADDTGQAVTIVSDKKWNVKKYPCIRWRWRVHQFPIGADERVGGKTDSPASLYITFYVSFFGVPKSIKYIWSNVNPECDVIRKGGAFKPVMAVAESGTTKRGVWITETINIYEHYKKVFGEYPPDETAGMAIRTDSDGTDSRAIADYDDIVVLSECDGKCR
ncbi:MAG: DUF3047 domain-containing protein [Bacteroidetes bacterium]|nr:DUF3047 domain-containing protein [Bacteroidota bacterium]